MPDLFPFQADTIQAFLLALTRVTATLAFIPVTGGRMAPSQVKVGLAFLVTIIIFPMLKTDHIGVDIDVFSMSLMIATEALIGLSTAFFVTLVFAGVQLAGSVIGFQAGFGIVNVVDPITSLQVSLTSQYFNLVTTLLFLAFNIHHIMILGVADSFNYVPLGGFNAHAGLLDILFDSMSAVYMAGAQISAPLTIMLLLKQAAMGLIVRTIPQMNIMIVGLPITIAFALISIAVSMPTMSVYIEKLFSRMTSQIGLIYYLMG
ncbi:Flagellar biosynthesis protein FliR [hydrothermal vent metagenome]|uniref:Flagellar biosynthesis protein FliR n=1 Tax=hydrothermal vent metagenome TaxID=652676 RepID=A0A3B1CKH5_9ZZZZ